MANLFYANAKKSLMNGGIDLDTDSFKVMLVTSAYTPAHTHEFRSSVTNEVSGTGYTAGGTALGTLSVTADTTNGWGVFDAADVSWASSSITARGAVIYKNTGVAATDNLVAYVDFGSDYTSDAGTFSLPWNASGILYF